MNELKNPFVFFSTLIILNIIAYLLNIGISKIWNAVNKHEETINKEEVKVSIFNLFLNIIIVVPGFLWWKNGIISFSGKSVIFSFVSLFLLIDFLMYILHWLSHKVAFLKKIHAKHHEHSEKFNSVSLYYISPWESILFGTLLTLVAYLFHFNLYGFILFLVFNWLYGVISHLNTKTDIPHFLIFTTNMFHKKHHQLNLKNFGFYTLLWDKLFGTAYKNNKWY